MAPTPHSCVLCTSQMRARDALVGATAVACTRRMASCPDHETGLTDALAALSAVGRAVAGGACCVHQADSTDAAFCGHWPAADIRPPLQ
ncbi:hypothetical protein XFF6992_580016 [Xanthomonas citri pv. fuscans]|nr:hypothetical protein XFF6992_580016 [Xanthomonas citri pv. fuscans]